MKPISVPIISHYQVEQVEKAFKKGESETAVSLNLNLSSSKISLTKSGIVLPDSQTVTWKQLRKVKKHQARCYLIEANKPIPIVIYSETTQWVRTLFPTKSAPTTLVSGILMHRIKDTDPWLDTQAKIEALGNLSHATLLDTATGLGYTAMQAAENGANVTTVELDPAAIDLARLNPWSKPLFTHPHIKLVIASLIEVITSVPSSSFSHILHDPPTQKLTGDLFSESLYRQFYDALKQGGKLFHYIGDPESKHGATITRGVTDRLTRAGFTRIKPAPKAFGILAHK